MNGRERSPRRSCTWQQDVPLYPQAMLLTDKTFKDAPKLKLARKLGQEDVRSGPRVAEPSSESGVLDGGAELGEDLGGRVRAGRRAGNPDRR